jgi:hypothetical protein
MTSLFLDYLHEMYPSCFRVYNSVYSTPEILASKKYPFSWDLLVRKNPSVTWDFFKFHMYKKCKNNLEIFNLQDSFEEFSENPNCNEDVLEYAIFDETHDINSLCFPSFSTIRTEKNMEIFHPFFCLNACTVSADYFFGNLDKDWDGYKICKSFSLENIQKIFNDPELKEKFFDFRGLLENPSVTKKFLDENHIVYTKKDLSLIEDQDDLFEIPNTPFTGSIYFTKERFMNYTENLTKRMGIIEDYSLNPNCDEELGKILKHDFPRTVFAFNGNPSIPIDSEICNGTDGEAYKPIPEKLFKYSVRKYI